MSLLAFGQTGQVARELARLGVRTLSRGDADLSDPQTCAEVIMASGASAVINAAAYTAVDRAEEEEALAFTVNSAAPAAMAKACAAKKIPLVHISTDYVFDGSGVAPFTPSDPVAPLGVYGRSKAAGEREIRMTGAVHSILRTSWVFSAHGANFVKTMLRLGAERDALSIVSDQIGGPTPAAAIARACVDMAERLQHDPSVTGTYHFSGAPDVSWADFARAIFAEARMDVAVTEIPSADYPTPAARPLNSRLDCAGTHAAFGISRPDWHRGLREVLTELRII
ncbi:dTDP-4-dehydrorhamnose reductase [Gymnodinialimonas ceratoperidinii]|uniref:dTDP-4-dehydrorhamnose reductase n=1 Tax=Gymnodinialimonas ceratoperidinii TaxID=2856823 RepID=A0A8F6YBR0_9RHOB|nr:dTDP-4-dehydrorhamnose reductase [Gymnodinialimonas ceratoperidinii]QXT40401.1 dTDP-4-dehydrorhamnose reductase [Gymnodinialimonas ceratoperidinii]